MSAKCEVPCLSHNSKFRKILREATPSTICAHFLTKSVEIRFQTTVAHDVKRMTKLQTTINCVAKKCFPNLLKLKLKLLKLATIYAEIISH